MKNPKPNPGKVGLKNYKNCNHLALFMHLSLTNINLEDVRKFGFWKFGTEEEYYIHIMHMRSEKYTEISG